MCGIAGIINLQGENSPQAQPVQKMTQRMTHRGPDDEGYLLVDSGGGYTTYYGDDTPLNDPASYMINGFPKEHIQSAYNGTSQVALGHRRLSIVDLSPHGHQPLCTPDKRYWIVFNGEIYNYQDIASDLKADGISLHGHSDTEVLLHAYVRWGERCLERFNGDFAFAIWDNKERYIFCARDRIGIKPFYYTIQNNQLIFASDIKTIIASGLYMPEVDPEGLYFAMAFGMAPRPLTAFKGIHALEQGHWMRIHIDGRTEKKRYWGIPVGTQERRMSETDAVELVDAELTQAVKLRLHADVAVGTFMSGGVDSTTISAIASRLHPGIKAFTLAYENTAPELDEVAQAEATARMNPMDHVIHRVNPNDSLTDLDSWIAGYEEPFQGLAANHVIAKLVKENDVTVVLNGLGGDELFAGYRYYRRAKLWPLISAFAPAIGLVSPFAGGGAARFSAIAALDSPDQLHTMLFQQTPDSELHQLFNHPDLVDMNTPERLQKQYADGVVFDDPVEAMSYMDLMNYVGNHHVHRLDQFTMAHSIEGRFPLLDHKLVEAAFRIPSKWKIRGGSQKYVLRQVAEKYIDPSCLAMNKKGFGLPLKQWMQGPLRPLVQAKIEMLKQRSLIHADTVTRWFDEYQKDRLPATRIWHLVALELWFERFIDQSVKQS